MEDEKIIDLFFERSQQAIVETDIKYGSMCMYIARNIICSEEDAEECVNDTYLGVWNSIPPTRPKVLSSYIAKITRNLAMKKITYANAQKRAANLTISLADMDSCFASPNGVANEVEYYELARCLERFLHEQNYESRNIFLRRYWFMDTVSDIAKRFRMSESNVKAQLYRTKIKLKKYLIKEGYLA